MKKFALIVAVFLLMTWFALPAFAESGSDEDSSSASWILLLAGPAFYIVISMKYSDAKKRHMHERETESAISNVTGSDVFVKSFKNSDTSSIGGLTFSNENKEAGLFKVVSNLPLNE